MQGIAHAGVTRLVLTDQLMPPLHTDRELVAKVRLAMLFRPACLDILLPALGRRPFGRHPTGLDLGLLLGAVVLGRGPDDAGVDDLPLARAEPVQLKLALHFLENHRGAKVMSIEKLKECLATAKGTLHEADDQSSPVP